MQAMMSHIMEIVFCFPIALHIYLICPPQSRSTAKPAARASKHAGSVMLCQLVSSLSPQILQSALHSVLFALNIQ